MKNLIQSEALKVKPAKRYLAKNTRSSSTLMGMADSLGNNNLMYWVAINVKCPSEALEILSHHLDSSILRRVAINNNCPHNVLDRLSRHSDPSIRMYVALNKKCPIKLLELLVKDECFKVRNTATTNLTHHHEAIYNELSAFYPSF